MAFISRSSAAAPLKVMRVGVRSHGRLTSIPTASTSKSFPCFSRSFLTDLRISDRSLLQKLRSSRHSESYGFLPHRFSSKFFSSHRFDAAHTATTIPSSLPKWLLGCSTLVLGIIIIGGLTRLTESGLSITEWQPLTGILPPITQAEWDVEWEKYRVSPEGIL